MKQHFLLSAGARTLSVRQVLEMSDQQAFDTFKRVRWGDHVVCPKCGVIDNHYFIRVRRQWRCKDCCHTFSVTSGTIFAFHKLPLKVYLAAIAIFTNAVKGISALQLGRDLGIQYKTAFVLAHKIRESLLDQRELKMLEGEIHVDGAYVNGHIRPKNKKADRVDRRLAIHQKPNKRCILTFRQRSTDSDLDGAVRTLTFVVHSENQEDISRLTKSFVKRGSTVHADENPAYDLLHAGYKAKRVNHQVEYSTDEGVSNNLAESYFSRFRRMQYGQTHKFGIEHLASYANEAAYREDTRRWPNGKIFHDILAKCLRTATNHDWCGYWQGNRRNIERLAC